MNKFTIITINYNNKVGLQKTIKSVFDQSFGDYEYIIIDGGSTDGSEEVIEQCAARLSYWVSESDKGIYHAMNKRNCAGSWRIFGVYELGRLFS